MRTDLAGEHSGGANFDAKLQSNFKIRYGWTKICNILVLLMIPGLSWKEVLSQEKWKQACFLTAVETMGPVQRYRIALRSFKNPILIFRALLHFIVYGIMCGSFSWRSGVRIRTLCHLKVYWNMTHKARFFIKRRIRFEKKFVEGKSVCSTTSCGQPTANWQTDSEIQAESWPNNQWDTKISGGARSYKKRNHCESHSSSLTVFKERKTDGRIVPNKSNWWAKWRRTSSWNREIWKHWDEGNQQTNSDAKYVTGTRQLDILAVTMVVFSLVPAKKFKSKFSRIAFRTSISWRHQPSKSRRSYRVEISMV